MCASPRRLVLALVIVAAAGVATASPRHGACVGGPVPPAVIVASNAVASVVLPSGHPWDAGAVTGKMDFVWDPGGGPVWSPRPDLNTAAFFLRDAVEKMTGRRLAVVSEDAVPAGPCIHLGRTRLAERRLGAMIRTLDRDGYVQLATPEGLLVCGGSDWGTIHGVSALLERYAGVLWGFPGSLGEVIPIRDTLTLNGVNWRDEPDFLGREFSGLESPNLRTPEEFRQSILWQLHNRLRPSRFKGLHNLERLVDAGTFGASRPEWYPLVNGKRTIPAPCSWGWQPCMTAPGLAEEIARQAVAYFDTHPGEETFSLANGDGAGWCECAACRAADGADADRTWGRYSGRYSRRLFAFFNRVAERVAQKHPDKKLGCLAYLDYVAPPSGLTLHPMLLPYVCSSRDGYYDPAFKRVDQANLEGWGALSRQFGVYEYFQGSGFLVPHIYTRLLAGALRHAQAHGAVGFMAETYPNWGLDAPKIHAAARLLWNVNEDPDALLTEYCDKLFGPAAVPMRAVFVLAETAACSPANPRRYGWFELAANNPRQLFPFTADVVSRINGQLAAARAAAPEGLIRQRVEFFARCYEMLNIVSPGYEAVRMMQQGRPMGEVLQAAVQPVPVAERLRRYWKEKNFGGLELYPSVYALDPAGWGGGLVHALDATRPSVHVTSEYGRRLGLEAATRAAAGVRDPAAFRARYRAALAAALAREWPGEPTNAALRELRAEIRHWAGQVAVAFAPCEPIRVDGNLDETTWAQALRNRGFIRHNEGTPLVTRTDFAVAADADTLYLAAWCPQPMDGAQFMAADAGAETSVFEGDSLEIFINGSEDGAPVVQVAVGLQGGFYDSRDGARDWNAAGTRSAVRRDPAGWTAEIALPWTSLGLSPSSQRPLRLNVVRNRYVREGTAPAPLEISTWFLSQGAHGDAHNRSWLVVLKEKGGQDR